jgi:putative PIN family toxin of toxin-antitoxin system
MISAVFDTNVLVSAACSPRSVPANLINKWLDDQFTLVLSEYILSEYAAVMSRKKIQTRYDVSREYIEKSLFLYRSVSEIVTVMFVPKVILRDPADDEILACALASTARYLVTGDKDLLDLKHYESISIVTPADFHSILSDST